MGSFLTNYHVRSDSPESVVSALQLIVRSKACVSPSKNGWVTVYDETSESQDDKELHRIAKEVSSRLGCVTLAFLVHDSDVLAYLLYEKGNLADEYNSKPDYFGPSDDATRQRYRGRTEVLLKLCATGTRPSEVERILGHGRGDDSQYAFEEDRLRELAALLGIDEDRACIGFNYYEHGDLEDIGGFRTLGKRGRFEDANRQGRKRKKNDNGDSGHSLQGWTSHVGR